MSLKYDPVNNIWFFLKLTEQNYHTQSEQIQAAFLDHYFWQYITENKPQSSKLSTFFLCLSATSSTKLVTSVKTTSILTQFFASAIANRKMLKPSKPQRPASKGPNEEETDFDFFFYSLNYIYQKKAQKCYYTQVQNDDAARILID